MIVDVPIPFGEDHEIFKTVQHLKSQISARIEKRMSLGIEQDAEK